MQVPHWVWGKCANMSATSRSQGDKYLEKRVKRGAVNLTLAKADHLSNKIDLFSLLEGWEGSERGVAFLLAL